jgi:hypothetical protein
MIPGNSWEETETQAFSTVKRSGLGAFMRGKKEPEGRAFDENDRAICVASTLSAPRPKDG